MPISRCVKGIKQGLKVEQLKESQAKNEISPTDLDFVAIIFSSYLAEGLLFQ
jgi:hypothetical protein